MKTPTKRATRRLAASLAIATALAAASCDDRHAGCGLGVLANLAELRRLGFPAEEFHLKRPFVVVGKCAVGKPLFVNSMHSVSNSRLPCNGASGEIPFLEMVISNGSAKKRGRPWVFPVGKFDTKPYSRETLAKKIGAPEFPPKAKLDVKLLSLRGDSESRSSGGLSKESTNLQNSKTPRSESNAEKVLSISIPMADGNPDSRVYAYNVVVVGDDVKARYFKSAFFSGLNAGIGHEPNHGVTTVDIPQSALPAGKKLTIAVRPVSLLGTKGKSIGTIWSA